MLHGREYVPRESIRNGWSCNQKAGRGNTRGKYKTSLIDKQTSITLFLSQLFPPILPSFFLGNLTALKTYNERWYTIQANSTPRKSFSTVGPENALTDVFYFPIIMPIADVLAQQIIFMIIYCSVMNHMKIKSERNKLVVDFCSTGAMVACLTKRKLDIEQLVLITENNLRVLGTL